MKIELTEKEYNTIDDILYEFAHQAKRGVAHTLDMLYIISNRNKNLTKYTSFGKRLPKQDIKAQTILSNNFSPTATRLSGFL